MSGRGWLLATGAALAIVPATWFARLVWTAPPLILLAAAVPAACWVTLIRLVDRPQREPWRAVAATFLWGAVIAAWLSSSLNDALQAWLGGLTGEADARLLTSALGGPVVEEIAKALALAAALAYWRTDFGGVLDGITYGALVGTGFAMTENVTYFTLATLQGGEPGLLRAIYLRAILGGGNHALFTATIGAGLGLARQTRSAPWRLLAPLLALILALAEHVAWNAVASGRITDTLCNPATPGGPCRDAPATVDLLITIPALVIVFIGPGVFILLVIAALARRALGASKPGS